MMSTARVLASLALALLVTACASPLMKPTLEGQEEYVPESGKVQVIFMRPSDFGGAIQSSVFHLKPDKDEFIGIVSANTKVRYIAEPGEHMFMVVGESADFMRAYLTEGKTYYALVSPRMGLWKARFSLKPIRREQLSTEEFAGWNEETRFVESTPGARQWAQNNWDSIQSKKYQYMEDWEAKSAADKEERTLRKEDGR